MSNHAIKSKQSHPSELWTLSACYSLFMYSYIAINALIVLYAIDHFKFQLVHAYGLYAAFNSLIFCASLPGGYLSGKFGHKIAAGWGLLLNVIGLLLICYQTPITFYVGLAIYVVGYGLATPALFTLVGFSYGKNDARRESGYTIFYLLINIGAAVAALSEGFIADYVGYQYAFLIAAFVLFIAFFIFIFFQKHYKPHSGESVNPQLKVNTKLLALLILLTSIIGIIIIIPLLMFYQINNILLWILAIFTIATILLMAAKLKHKFARYKLLAYLFLTIIAISFWSLYMLESSLMTIFIKSHVNRELFNITIPAPSFISLDPIGVIIFGVIFSWLWLKLAKHNRVVSIPTKFATAIISIGIGYGVFSAGTYLSGQHLVNPGWIVFGYVFMTAGEVLLAPTGMSMVGKLSPPGKEGFLMGVWTFFVGFSAIISSYLADLTTIHKVKQATETKPIFTHFFFTIGVCTIIIGIFVTILIPVIKMLINSKPTTHQP